MLGVEILTVALFPLRNRAPSWKRNLACKKKPSTSKKTASRSARSQSCVRKVRSDPETLRYLLWHSKALGGKGDERFSRNNNPPVWGERDTKHLDIGGQGGGRGERNRYSSLFKGARSERASNAAEGGRKCRSRVWGWKKRVA